MKKVVLALLLATGIATPALADPPKWSATQVRFDRDGRDHDDRGKWRGDRRERASEHRDRRRYDRHDNWNNGRPVGRNHDGRYVDRHNHRSVQIGRASCRERVCQSVSIWWAAGSLKKKKKQS